MPTTLTLPTGPAPARINAAPCRALALLALSLTVLIGVAGYGVFKDRNTLMANERDGVLALADSMQVHATDLLTQTLYSLQGAEKDLLRTAPDTLDGRLLPLRQAMRYDPASWVLGVHNSAGTLMVDGSGDALRLPDLQATVDSALASHASGKLSILPAIYASDRREWYLPIRMPLARPDGRAESVFALIAARKLIGTAASIGLLPGAYMGLSTTDGERLFQYRPDTREISVNTRRVQDNVAQRLRQGGSFDLNLVSELTGDQTLFGVSTSSRFPLAVGVAVPAQALTEAWLERSLGQILLLLMATVSVALFALRLKSASRKEWQHLRQQEYLASHDSLTGLLNRNAFQRRVQECIDAAGARSFCLVSIGLNRFKEINDTLGHHAGDTALAEVARRLRDLCSGGRGVVVRKTGDEMAVWVSWTGEADGMAQLCDELQGCVGAPIPVDGVVLELTARLGVAVFPDDARTPSDLLRCADIAMDAAKRELRPFQRYSTSLDHFTPEGLALQADFARALRDGGLSLVYQPKVSLRDGRLVGVEALSRWVHPVNGPVSPAVFVPLAETTELIHPFTEFVLREALAQASRWQRAGLRVPVSVNISTNNLMDAHFVELTRRLLSHYDVPAGQLELEVTESALMRSPETALARLAELRALGVALSIDDFGTGYASLAYLKRLPVDVLKIDKTFTAGLATDEGDMRIVRSTIQLAHGFGMQVVAEGVESADVAALLQREGCEFAQGYHFSRPLTAAELTPQLEGSMRD